MKFQHIAIIGTHADQRVAQTIYHLFSLLSRDTNIYLEEETSKSLDCRISKIYSLKEISRICDLVVVVGGDGNFLHAGRYLSSTRDIPIIGINRGKLGFLTEITPDEIEAKLFPILQGRYIESKCFMLEASIKKKDSHKYESTGVALNDIVVTSGMYNRLFQMEVYIDEYYVLDQRADGIIIATPTGSTAHSLSAGGPIIHPSVSAMSLVPICSHSLNSRPLIFSTDSTVVINIKEFNDPEPIINFDGQTRDHLVAGDKIRLRKHKRAITILHSEGYDYFESLRSKLHWGRML